MEIIQLLYCVSYGCSFVSCDVRVVVGEQLGVHRIVANAGSQIDADIQHLLNALH